jgi:hypothetical protein
LKNIRRCETKKILKGKESPKVFSNSDIKILLFKNKQNKRFAIHFLFFRKIFKNSVIKHKEMHFIKNELKDLRKKKYGLGILILVKRPFFYKDIKYNEWKNILIDNIEKNNL